MTWLLAGWIVVYVALFGAGTAASWGKGELVATAAHAYGPTALGLWRLAGSALAWLGAAVLVIAGAAAVPPATMTRGEALVAAASLAALLLVAEAGRLLQFFLDGEAHALALGLGLGAAGAACAWLSGIRGAPLVLAAVAAAMPVVVNASLGRAIDRHRAAVAERDFPGMAHNATLALKPTKATQHLAYFARARGRVLAVLVGPDFRGQLFREPWTPEDLAAFDEAARAEGGESGARVSAGVALLRAGPGRLAGALSGEPILLLKLLDENAWTLFQPRRGSDGLLNRDDLAAVEALANRALPSEFEGRPLARRVLHAAWGRMGPGQAASLLALPRPEGVLGMLLAQIRYEAPGNPVLEGWKIASPADRDALAKAAEVAASSTDAWVRAEGEGTRLWLELH